MLCGVLGYCGGVLLSCGILWCFMVDLWIYGVLWSKVMLWCFMLDCCGVVVLYGGVLWRVVVFNDGVLWSFVE